MVSLCVGGAQAVWAVRMVAHGYDVTWLASGWRSAIATRPHRLRASR